MSVSKWYEETKLIDLQKNIKEKEDELTNAIKENKSEEIIKELDSDVDKLYVQELYHYLKNKKDELDVYMFQTPLNIFIKK